MDNKAIAKKRKKKRLSAITNNLSHLNIYTPPSTSSDEVLPIRIPVPATVTHNRKILEDIVDNIFEEQTGIIEISSSYCSSVRKKSSEYSFDRRLKYWKNVLEERKKIGVNIKKKIGKPRGEILFNRAITVDDRDKQTVKRLLDYADRMNPRALINKKKIILQEYDDCQQCRHINELRETLPKAERDFGTIVEISGLPKVAKEEILGRTKDQGVEKKHHWLRSKLLERRIEEKREDIERVIEYYPDIENLQIVGESLTRINLFKHNPEIELIGDETIKQISSDTSLGDVELNFGRCYLRREEEEEILDYGIKVNEYKFTLETRRSAKTFEIETYFKCLPYQKCIKRVMRLENIGQKILNCEWIQRNYYERTIGLLPCTDKEFLFSHRAFRIIPREILDIVVQYQPRRADICKEKWLLRIDPQFFCRKTDGIILKLNGDCRPPPEYIEKVDAIQKDVINKSNMTMMRKLTSGISSITPLISPAERICPYKRELNEMELFGIFNPGYKCDRYHDLVLLKDLHKRIKKPRDPAWDLKLESLKEKILQIPSADRRALLFDEMCGLLQEMKGTPPELEERIAFNPERIRSCFLFVRGIISSGIDEWEEITYALEEASLKPAFKNYYNSLIEEDEEDEDEDEEESHENDGNLLILDEADVRIMLLKKIRRRKTFRDTLYIETYTHLCNFMEDIVSIIEGTDVI